MKKHILWLAAALTLLFCMALPAAAEGEEETIPALSPATEDAVTLIPEEALAAEPVDSIDLGARERIETAYQEALQLTGRKSFRGYCGSYVNHLLMVYGINTSYISGNGNRFFRNCKDRECTSGGYDIWTYYAEEYGTLLDILQSIADEAPVVHHVALGFSKGTSEAGKKYGHCIFIDTIYDGKVYYSESFGIHIGGERYKEGDAIVCSLEDFCRYYRNYKLDGVLHFVDMDGGEESEMHITLPPVEQVMAGLGKGDILQAGELPFPAISGELPVEEEQTEP